MKTNSQSLLILVALCLLSLSSVFAAPGGANITVTNTDTFAPLPYVGNTTINAGELKTLTINNTLATTRWAGFLGDLSGLISLSDASGSTFFQWTSQVTGSYIYAANDTTDFTGLRNGTAADFPAYLSQPASDNFTGTFAQNEIISATGFILDGINTSYAQTNSGTGTFRTYSLADSSATYILATRATANATGYDSNNVDFQLLLPASTSSQYFFYVELA